MACDRYYRYMFLSFFFVFLCSVEAFQFRVGSKDGWTSNPSENYDHWAERMRFQVNDTLLFRYKKGTDSVLVVNPDDYHKCSSGKPISKLDGGDSVFKFDRSGPFFFISGKKSNCDKGQKLIVVVLAVRHGHSLPPPATGPSSSSTAPAPEWQSPQPEADQSPYSSPAQAPAGVSDTPPASSSQPPRRSSAPPGFGPCVFLVPAVSFVLSSIGLIGLVG